MKHITENIICSFKVDKELWYVDGLSGNSRRYHLFHIGFDRYNHELSSRVGWTFNMTLPFVSMYIGYIFEK